MSPVFAEILKKIQLSDQEKPEIGLILGSGLGDLAEQIIDPKIIPYHTLPNFPLSTVQGHKGQFVIGRLEGKRVIAMQGRYHHYEGYSLKQVVLPVYVMKLLGIDTLFVTNASGAINTNFQPGDMMLIRDHINLLGASPLAGPNEEAFGARFPDMSAAYDSQLIELARKKAEELHLTLREGVYLATPGPQYETPAEIRMMRILGADAVGMSTVPEVIAANQSGLRVLGISCMTNMASGILNQPLSHEEVIATSGRVKDHFIALIRHILADL